MRCRGKDGMEVLGCNLVEDAGVGGVELPVIHYLGQCQGTSLIIHMAPAVFLTHGMISQLD